MTSSQAKREFEIRYYLWAISEFQDEIEHSFQNFGSFKTGHVWKLQRFIEKLDRADQLVLASAMLKRFHPDAVRTLNESCSPEEQALRNQLDSFRNRDAGPEIEIAARRRAGEKLKFTSKRKLLKITSQTFQSAFKACSEIDRDEDYDPHLRFQMESGGWVIYTNFWFGRQESLIDYCHGIATKSIFAQKGAKGVYHAQFPMGMMLSFCSWLGICSQTQWKHLQTEDVSVACDALVKHCAHFFEVTPKLLKGLEIDSISEE
jgi:hypothetical protein